MTLLEDLQYELNRNKLLLSEYEAIPTGMFGAVFIRQSIKAGEKAITDLDTVGMIKALKSLKENN